MGNAQCVYFPKEHMRGLRVVGRAISRLIPMILSFLDANVFLRHLLQDDPDQSSKASSFLKHIEEGEVKVRTAETVIFERGLYI